MPSPKPHIALRRRRSRRALIAIVAALVAPMASNVGLAHASTVGGVLHAEAGAPWVEGKSDQDTIESCITNTAATGVMASVAWQPLGGEVPKVGERFVVRATAALIGQPCSGGVTMFLELMAPAGLTYGDDAVHPVQWGIRKIEDPVSLTTGGLVYEPGSNGGVVILRENHQPFILRRGELLEVQVPVIATREMRGMATQQPECLDRRNGTRPCPVDQSGDHFQAAFRVGGHGGNKNYVTPYVGLFAQAAGQTPSVPLPTPVNPTTPPATVRMTSDVKAVYAGHRSKPGKVRVTVRSASEAPTGTVVVLDGRKKIARMVLKPTHRGKVTLKLPRFSTGIHRLSVQYGGSDSVAPSASKVHKFTIR